VVLLSVTIAAIVVVQDWHKLHLRAIGWLLGPTLLGIPLGIALLTSIREGRMSSEPDLRWHRVADPGKTRGVGADPS
jgi:hypothetical protein